MPLTCIQCQAQLPDDAAFCHKCGAATGAGTVAVEPHFCERCGVLLKDDALFCLACGTPVATERSHWMTSRVRAREDEITKGMDVFKTEDFEDTKHRIILRACDWADYADTILSAPDWFSMLRLLPDSGPIAFFSSLDGSFFPTNKPNAQKALVQKTMIDRLLSRARQRGYIDHTGKCSQTVSTYLQLMRDQIGEPDPEDDWFQDGFRLQPDYSKLDELAKKDDQLFPPAQQIRVETSGIILNFSTDEGVVLVYADRSQEGKTVVIDIPDTYLSSAYRDRRQTKLSERSFQGETYCVAIFNNIPFVTETHRHREEVVRQLQIPIRCFSATGEWKEIKTVFRGQVTELDWRGRKA